jgi:hypothetical protein
MTEKQISVMGDVKVSRDRNYVMVCRISSGVSFVPCSAFWGDFCALVIEVWTDIEKIAIGNERLRKGASSKTVASQGGLLHVSCGSRKFKRLLTMSEMYREQLDNWRSVSCRLGQFTPHLSRSESNGARIDVCCMDFGVYTCPSDRSATTITPVFGASSFSLRP